MMSLNLSCSPDKREKSIFFLLGPSALLHSVLTTENDTYFLQSHIAKYAGGVSPDKPRFNVKPKTETEMKAKIRDMQTFLASPTSTKAGIVSVYKKKADTINKRYGTDWTWEDVAKYFLKKQNEKYDKIAASKTILIAIGKIQKAEDEYDMTYTEMKNMAWKATGKNASRSDYRIDKDDPIMDQTIKKLLRTVSLKEYL